MRLIKRLKELKAEERKEEKKRGEKRGEKRGKADLINNMYNNGVTPEQISSMTNVDLDTVKKIVYGKKSVMV